jgi:alpha-acetolactate decarboxylase
MTEIHAKPIVDGKFWIVEKDGNKIATLHKKENNKFVLSSTNGEVMFNKKEDLQKQFGKEFFLKNTKVKVSTVDVTEQHEVHGFPAMCKPYNSMYDVRRRLPLFTKSNQSKSLFCAGHYVIKFTKNWVRSFCPKLITIERYAFSGPYLTEEESKEVLANVK